MILQRPRILVHIEGNKYAARAPEIPLDAISPSDSWSPRFSACQNELLRIRRTIGNILQGSYLPAQSDSASVYGQPRPPTRYGFPHRCDGRTSRSCIAVWFSVRADEPEMPKSRVVHTNIPKIVCNCRPSEHIAVRGATQHHVQLFSQTSSERP